METLGRYQILGELGRGGCGIVYGAMDPRIGRKVAIKTILADLDTGDGHSYRERLRREAHAAGVLSHANIVTVHEFEELGDLTYIVMEYVEGQTLAQKMKGEPQSVEFIISFLRQAAEALDFAHSKNIVHRDVKPGNFLITAAGLVKVADFGIAKALGVDSDLTKTGTLVGTVHYMSPEQIASKQATGLSDQFSLAVIAYEMTTGQRPFQGDSWASILHQIVTAIPPPVRQFRASLGDSVTTVLRKGLAKDPAERYSSCREFAEEFNLAIFNTTAERTLPRPFAEALKRPLPPPQQEELSSTKTTAYQPGIPKTRSRWALITIAGAAVLALYGGWVAYRPWTNSRPETARPAAESKAAEAPPSIAVSPPPPEELKPAPQERPVVTKAAPKERPIAAGKTSSKTSPPRPEPSPPPSPIAAAPLATSPQEQSPPALPVGKYRGPPEGRFSWTGTLAPSGRLTITGNRASTGALAGRGLPPGLAVTVQVEPATIQVMQQPAASNNFQLILGNTGAAEVGAVNISWRENKD
jgi:serine/threonine protein kinase